MKSLGAWFVRQFRFVIIGKYVDSSARLRVLDVGCGLTSPDLTRRELPNCEYHSVDLLSAEEMRSKYGSDVADRYVRVDLDRDGLRALSGRRFDVVILAHVLEHLSNGLEVLAQAVDLVAPGGVIYVEYPRLVSVNLPSMSGTLNFHDDVTHKRFYNLTDVANVIVAGGLLVRSAAVRRLKRRVLLLPLGALYALFKYGRLRAGIFWDLLGFAEFVVAVRPRDIGAIGPRGVSA